MADMENYFKKEFGDETTAGKVAGAFNSYFKLKELEFSGGGFDFDQNGLENIRTEMGKSPIFSRIYAMGNSGGYKRPSYTC